MRYYLPIFLYIIDMVFGKLKLTNLKDIKYYELIELRHLDAHGRNRRDLSTFDHAQNRYLEETTFTFFGHRRYFHLRIYKNKFLIPDRYTTIYQEKDGSYNFDKEVHHCFYHGYLVNRIRSFGTISTCYGLKGVIRDEDGDEFVIEPHLHLDSKHRAENNGSFNSHRYILFKSKDVVKNGERTVCGVNDVKKSISRLYYEMSPSSYLHPEDINEHHRMRRSNTDMKYVEVVVVLDNLEFKEHGGNLNATLHRGFEIFNAVDSMYKTMNTRVAVVNMIVWNIFNLATVSKNAGETLSSLEKYTRDVLHGEMKLTFDNTQLISSQTWDSLVGLAGVGVICTHTSSAINRDHNTNPAITANTVAHELGHNIGFMHNTNTCVCHKGPCVMSGDVPMSPCQSFTNCSKNEYVKRLASGDLPCLLDFPEKLFGKPKCGNGYVEEGEECDCGNKVECKKLKLNKCCNFTTCRLQKSAQCATGSCCKNCKFKRKGSLCRANANKDCDLEEFCSGQSGTCPKNFHRQDGTPCKHNTAYCYQGTCKTQDSQCKLLWGKNAVKADDTCFLINIRRGDVWGNCGKNAREDYIKCERKDVLCGKLQCTAKSPNHPLPKFPIIGYDRLRMNPITFRRGHKKVVCYFGITTVSIDLQDPSMTEAGVKCGNNSMCIDHACTHLSAINHIKKCSKQCFDAGGVCNNNGNCHCPKGLSCPSCELAGPGGSADSGQGCILDDACDGCYTPLVKAMLVLFLVVFPVITFISCVLYRKRKWLRTRCSSPIDSPGTETTPNDWFTDEELSPDFPSRNVVGSDGITRSSNVEHPFIKWPPQKSTVSEKIPPPIPARPPSLY